MLTPGQRAPLSTLGLSEQFTVTVASAHPDTDVAIFGLTGGKMLDEYMTFYNQLENPEQSVRLQGNVFHVDLSRVQAVDTLYLTATRDGAPLRGQLDVTVSGGAQLQFRAGEALQDERAAMLLRFYRHQGQWRLEAVGQGFNGGLDALVRHFGGEVSDAPAPAAAPATPAPAPAQPPAAPISLVKQRQAVMLQKAEQSAPQMVNLIKQAAISLEKRGLDELTANVVLVLDISASMTGLYQNGAVQTLAEKALAIAARLDNDGQAEVILFGVNAKETGSIGLTDITGAVGRLRFNYDYGTNYAPAINASVKLHRKTKNNLPTLVLFITDGENGDSRETERAMIEASKEAVFFKFMGIRQGRQSFPQLEKLDDMRGRTVDNADFFAWDYPNKLSDAEMFELLVNELDGWLKAARAKGVLR